MEPEEQRAASRAHWDDAAEGWGRRADEIREWGMPVARAMVDSLSLSLASGQRVLDLAAGPGDTGFLAAGALGPAGSLICSDGAAAMVEVARRRAAELGLSNVEFKQLELEWIDLGTASVDAVLVRWGIMLAIDPLAAAKEIRRVLAPGGRAALAVWDAPERNPWATIPSGALAHLGLAEPPDPDAPGRFALSGDGQLSGLLQDAGFTEVAVQAVPLDSRYAGVEDFIAESSDLSPTFSATYHGLDDERRARVVAAISSALAPYATADGAVAVPGSSLVAAASA
ncbi:MAG: methyltransferase domain-containing protein [Solirubrobacterales bacterium]|nr:methyltransferase domain-containing protein [Solirubrobacterales bacterium]